MLEIQLEDLERFISENVGITIYDDSWADQSPLRSEKITNIALCPSETHIRVYFNDTHFFAIPRIAVVSATDTTWTAVDEAGGLHYVIQKE